MKSERQSQHASPGKLYGVGAGPGAPDLLTLRAIRILQACPVICLPGREGVAPISANLMGDGRQGQAQPLQDGTAPEADERPIIVGAGLAPAFGPMNAPAFGPMNAPAFGPMNAPASKFAPMGAALFPSYAGSIIEKLIDKQRQEVLLVQFPMRRDLAEARPARARAADRVIERLVAGYDVAFVTEGDPSLYSTFGYVLEKVKRQCPTVPVEVVPGVSSITAAAAAATVPLAAWDERVAIIPAAHALNSSGSDDLRTLLRLFDTVVLLKVNTVFDALLDLLEELGLARHAFFVRRCSTDLEEVVFDLARLRNQLLDYFSLVIVRKPYCKTI